MDGFKEFLVEAELNPGAMEEWLSIIQEGKKIDRGTRRSDLSIKAKKHLSALGWVFAYFHKGKKRELRYKSPKGRWFYSLATACMSCVDQQQQIVHKSDLPCSVSKLSSQGSSDFVKIVSTSDVSNQKQSKKKSERVEEENRLSDLINNKKKMKLVKDCDTAAAFNGSTPNKEEKNRMSCVDQDSRQQQQQIVPESDLPCSLSKLSSKESSDFVNTVTNSDVSNQKQNKKKRERVEDCDIHVSTQNEENRLSDLINIVPDFDVSNQQQNKKKKMELVKDCDTAAAFNGSTPNKEEKNGLCDSIEIILNIDVSDQQQNKRRPRIGKSLRKILEVIEENNQREKECLRFWRKDCGPEMNCDVCCVCHYGGELILCDGCPSAFHHTCLGLSSLPEEDLWFCPCCCCDICGSMESSGNNNSKLMSCEQCQRRFHLKCLKDGTCVVSSRGWFCSSQCDRVFIALENLLGRKIAVGDNGDLVWTLMRAPNEEEHYDKEQISKLDSAVEILHQGFEPTKDPFSGKDLVEELIFSRDGSGTGRGFYTVLIERKNEPITVAAIRVDKDVAEIPLVATLSSYRRSGMCRVLMDELEKQMTAIGVCRLVLPAANEVVNTWTERFGFTVMESSERLEVVKHGMLDFVGTVMCHKYLREREKSAESSLTE